MILLRNILLAVCVLAFCASLTLWWRSQWTADGIQWRVDDRTHLLLSNGGRLAYVTSAVPLGVTARPRFFQSILRTQASSFTGVAFLSGNLPYNANSWAGFEWTSRVIPARLPPPKTGPSSPALQQYVDAFYKNFTPRLIAIPWWAVSLVTSIPLLLFVRSYRKTLHHLRTGRCAACGYDLRATPDRCPECGTVPSSFQKFPETLQKVSPDNAG